MARPGNRQAPWPGPALLLVLLLAAGCGGDSDEGPRLAVSERSQSDALAIADVGAADMPDDDVNPLETVSETGVGESDAPIAPDADPDAAILSACSAPAPGPETCNGLDDDCNGATDDAAPCDDGKPCTTDLCQGGQCAATPNQAACTDGDACTQGDTCQGGQCLGKVLVCDDGNLCTSDACQAAKGCVFTANETPCDDGEACTKGDACGGGKCKAGTNLCACQLDKDCPDDGNACNGKSFCDKAQQPYACKLVAGSTVTCPAAPNPCTAFACDAKDGVCKPSAQNQGKACDDGSACTSTETCQNGACSGKPTNCDDGQACTADSCDPAGGCKALPIAGCAACKPGFQASGGACVDVDECGTAGFCPAAATCTNLPGSATCACKPGYTGDGKTCHKKGSQAVPAVSCLEIFTLYPNSADGTYWLDFDGVGPLAPGTYLCDMKGGGWTLLVADDFEDGTAKGWSPGKTSKCGDFGTIFGGYEQFGAGAASSKTVPATPTHTKVRVFMHFLRLDSWDKEEGQVLVDGAVVWKKKGSLWSGQKQCGVSYVADEKWDALVETAHKAPTIALKVTSDLNQGAGNESFGFDNVGVWVK